MLRYDEPDDFGLPETAFLICTFWYIDALAAVGGNEEARELFEQHARAPQRARPSVRRPAPAAPKSYGAIFRRPIRMSA